MKILICSDSHGLTEELIELKQQHADVDYYIHCGDSELEKEDPAISGYYIVKGNCDYRDDFPNELVVDAGENRIFITHGHLYHIKTSLTAIKYRALEHQANIVCFGHSHVLGIEMIDGILFINPGSILMPRMRKEKTYVILEITDSAKIVHVFDINKGELFKKTLTE